MLTTPPQTDTKAKESRRNEKESQSSSKKNRPFDDVTNTPSPSQSPAKASWTPKAPEEDLHSLVSPSKEALHSKKRKELKNDVALLAERLQAMEDIQIINNKSVVELHDKLKEKETQVSKLRSDFDAVMRENQELKEEVKRLKAELDRHVTAKWKTAFLS